MTRLKEEVKVDEIIPKVGKHFCQPNLGKIGKCSTIVSYNITSGMIIIDDIMSEMSCFNFTNLISSMINHTTCYIR
jgi:hypothetical protein